MDNAGTVNCMCGGIIIDNYGKVIYRPVGMITCWNPECSRLYDYDVIAKVRTQHQIITFKPPGLDLKVFRMNDCDWWMDYNLKEAIKNYVEFTKDAEMIYNPYELTETQLKGYKFITEYGYPENYTFMDELQRVQSMRDTAHFFASTEF